MSKENYITLKFYFNGKEYSIFDKSCFIYHTIGLLRTLGNFSIISIE